MMDLLTTRQAAEIARGRGLKIEASSITVACMRGKILGAMKMGRDWFIPRDTFMAWVADESKHKTGPRPKEGEPLSASAA